MSSFPDVQDAIYTAVAAIVPSDTQVLKFFPLVGDKDDKLVAIRGFDDLEEEFRALGQGAKRVETYNVMITIAYYNVSAKENAGVVSVRDTVMGLYNLVRYAIHADYSLGGICERAAVSGAESKGVQAITGGGYGMNVDVSVGVRARIDSVSPVQTVELSLDEPVTIYQPVVALG